MTLFYVKKEARVVPVITSEFAQAIYDGFKKKKTRTQLFKENVVDTPYIFEYIQSVYEEKNVLESEVLSKMNGTYLVSAAEYDGIGNKTKDEVYFSPTTEKALIDSVSSAFNSETFIGDMIKWADGCYMEDRTWEQYKLLFQVGE